MAVSDSSVVRLRQQLRTIRDLLEMDEARFLESCPPTSAWCTAEHLDHVLKVNQSIVYFITKKDAKRLPQGIRMIGRIILTIGRIPRGKGRAPEKVIGTRIPAGEIRKAADAFEQSLDALTEEQLSSARGPLFRHPVFGGLDARQSLRFADIHTDHHLRIVRDMLTRRRG